MIQNTQAVSPLRQRMIEDMMLRKLSPKTQSAYIRAVKKLSSYLGHSPDTANAEELRRFQLHLADKGISSISRLLTTLNNSIQLGNIFTPTMLY